MKTTSLKSATNTNMYIHIDGVEGQKDGMEGQEDEVEGQEQHRVALENSLTVENIINGIIRLEIKVM